jgi:hypothetical protein
MSKIIQPMGPIIKRIVLEVDATGRVRSRGVNLHLEVETSEMSTTEVLSFLAQTVATSVTAFFQQIEAQAKRMGMGAVGKKSNGE